MFCFAFAVIVVNLLVALTINATEELAKEGGVRQSKKKVQSVISLLNFQQFIKQCVACGWTQSRVFDEMKVSLNYDCYSVFL